MNQLTSVEHDTTTTETTEAPESTVRAAVFEDIVCGIDGSRGANEAMQQALALSGEGGTVRFVSIYHTIGVGLNEQSTLSEGRAGKALADGEYLAARQGLEATTSLISGTRASEVLRAEAADHDLLVIGTHGGSRRGGIMLGGTSTLIAHRCERPLLIARHCVDHDPFPASVLLATDGSPGSWAATKAAIRLATRRQAEVRVVFVPDGEDRGVRRKVFEQRSAIEGATGTLPTLYARPGSVPERICQAAEVGHSELLVIGRRGVGGVKALGSVSERVAHRASCSVLLVPPEASAAPPGDPR